MIVHMREQSDIAVFVRVVELGSFTKAADALEISKAAVSKYVNRLEQRLAARLLHRTTRRLALTEAGQALYGRSAPALVELAEAEHDVAQLTGKPRGMLRVTAPIYLGVTVLAAHIAAFRAKYPEVRLDLDFSDRLVDIVKERFDLAIRISAMQDSSLVATRLAPCPTVLVGSPAYFRRHGTPKTPEDLMAHQGLGYSIVKTPNEWKFRAGKGRWVTVTMPSTIRCNNDFALKQFALDGLGLALFPRFFAERELASGKLVQAIPDYPPPELSISAVYESRRHLLPKLQAFLGFLKAHFGAES
jgi:DNA-binding transcriptional LysR family regulator